MEGNDENLGTLTETTKSAEQSSCGTCNKTVTNRNLALCCDVCELWFHIKWQNVSTKLYEALRDEEEDCPWYCKISKQGAKNLRLQVIAIRRENEAIKAALGNLTKQCSNNILELTRLSRNMEDRSTSKK